MKLLTYTSPAKGHLFPITPVLGELRRRNHEVVCRTLVEHLDDLAPLGISGDAISPDVMAIEIDDWKGSSPPEAQQLAMAAFGRRAPLDAADLRDAIDSWQPDAVLVDSMSFGALAVAEASGLPWASWLPYPAWLKGPGIPPYGPGLPPLAGPEGEARDTVVAQLVAGGGAAMTAAVNAGRDAVGLGPLAEPDDILLRPPVMLYMTTEEFEYPRPAWPTSFKFVGPCIWEPPSTPPAWLEEDERPILLVSTSSEYQDDGRLVSAAIDAFARRDDLLIVATVPAVNIAIDALPEHIHLEPFVGHSHLLARAVAVVCHGGMGITQKSLAAGVPVCAVPFGRDQLEVARRLAVSGAGTCLGAGELTADSLQHMLEPTLACTDAARHMATAYAAVDGVSVAADAIETLRPAKHQRSTVTAN